MRERGEGGMERESVYRQAVLRNDPKNRRDVVSLRWLVILLRFLDNDLENRFPACGSDCTSLFVTSQCPLLPPPLLTTSNEGPPQQTGFLRLLASLKITYELAADALPASI